MSVNQWRSLLLPHFSANKSIGPTTEWVSCSGRHEVPDDLKGTVFATHYSGFVGGALFALKGGGGFYCPLEAPLYPHENAEQDDLVNLSSDMYAAFLSYVPGAMVHARRDRATESSR